MKPRVVTELSKVANGNKIFPNPKTAQKDFTRSSCIWEFLISHHEITRWYVNHVFVRFVISSSYFGWCFLWIRENQGRVQDNCRKNHNQKTWCKWSWLTITPLWSHNKNRSLSVWKHFAHNNFGKPSWTWRLTALQDKHSRFGKDVKSTVESFQLIVLGQTWKLLP